jgi:hypothetical protein
MAALRGTKGWLRQYDKMIAMRYAATEGDGTTFQVLCPADPLAEIGNYYHCSLHALNAW